MQGKKTKRHFVKITLQEVEVITYQEKVWMPANCWKELTNWYHKNFQHCGEEIMQHTIRNNFKWLGWTTQVDRAVKACKLCQEYKVTRHKNYGKVPMQEDKTK
eukprot:15345114-Ditylum_brightwellii.AAC.1